VSAQLGASSPDFAALRAFLLRYARLQLRDDAAAEDAVQETLLVIHEKAAEFRGEAQHRTWAVSILKNKVADMLRAKLRHLFVSVDDEAAHDDAFDALFKPDGHWAEAVPQWQTPHGQLERDQLRAALQRCLERLPPNTGRLFMLREWMGWELPEVCREFGCTADNARQMMYRARMLMRECLQTAGFGR
jgi:RNA polymerase sigma-70 factor (ECF subfamily)